jgi:hypothetical protein
VKYHAAKEQSRYVKNLSEVTGEPTAKKHNKLIEQRARKVKWDWLLLSCPVQFTLTNQRLVFLEFTSRAESCTSQLRTRPRYRTGERVTRKCGGENRNGGQDGK